MVSRTLGQPMGRTVTGWLRIYSQGVGVEVVQGFFGSTRQLISVWLS